jgi:hypothetical protein
LDLQKQEQAAPLVKLTDQQEAERYPSVKHQGPEQEQAAHQQG